MVRETLWNDAYRKARSLGHGHDRAVTLADVLADDPALLASTAEILAKRALIVALGGGDEGEAQS